MKISECMKRNVVTISAQATLRDAARLFVQKHIGIVLLSLLAVRLGWSRLPEGVSWRHILGAGFVAGIGFTMSIFITLLAFADPEIVQSSKASILLTSLISGITGYLILRGRLQRVGESPA